MKQPRVLALFGDETGCVLWRVWSPYAELERRGYRFLGFEFLGRELRMIKKVPIDGPGFRAVLKEIVPLARSHASIAARKPSTASISSR